MLISFHKNTMNMPLSIKSYFLHGGHISSQANYLPVVSLNGPECQHEVAQIHTHSACSPEIYNHIIPADLPTQEP